MTQPDMAQSAQPDMAQSVPPDMAGPMLSVLAGQLNTAGSADGTGTAAQFNFPVGAAGDGQGNLYITDYGNHTIRKVVLSTGVVTTLAGTAGMTGSTNGTGAAARFNNPVAVAGDGQGNIYVTERVNHTIRKIVVATGVVTTLAGGAGMAGSTDGTGTAARFSYPAGVVVDSTGNLYVADRLNHTIRKVVLSTGAVTTLAGTAGMTGSTNGTGAAARFNQPVGVTLDGSSTLYVTDNVNNTIRMVAVNTGVVTTLAGTAGTMGSADGTGAAARFNSPQLIAWTESGDLYVAEEPNSTVRKIMLPSGVVTTFAGVAGQSGVKLGLLPGGLKQPLGVSAHPTNGGIIIVDAGANAVLLAK